MSEMDEAKPIELDGEDSGNSTTEIEESPPPEEESDPSETEYESQEKKPKTWVRRVLYGFLIFLLIVGLGAIGGVMKGTNDRVHYEDVVIGTAISDQFVRALVDMENENYEIAIERFKYILTYDPDHAGARQQLTIALLELGSTGDLPTLVPTSTLPPTQDFRNEEELYNQALALRNTQDWNGLIATLDSLRKANPEYMAVEVDGLYYLAYRNRGLQRIQINGNLEGGIFDINRAELFGPIDIEASNYRQWSEWYLTGVSFWDLDWEQAVAYFGLVAPSAPNLSDSGFFTASARLATAQVSYGNYLISRARMMFSQRSYCDAYSLYSTAQQYVLIDANNQEKYTDAEGECFGRPEPTATSDSGGTTPVP
jgi:tetratricopeptide (TPR) repeat protein